MLYNRWKRWGEVGVFVPMMEGLAAGGAGRRTTELVSDDTGAAAVLNDLPKAPVAAR